MLEARYYDGTKARFWNARLTCCRFWAVSRQGYFEREKLLAAVQPAAFCAVVGQDRSGSYLALMPILIADSNFLGKQALRAYLAHSRSNRIALADEVLVEMHKRDPAYNVQKSLEIARGFPKQVIVLRSVTRLYGVPIRSAADARKLIDPRQTKAFAQWYDDVSQTETQEMMVGFLAEAQQQAQAQVDEIAAAVKNVQPIFRSIKTQFDKVELTQMRKRAPYSNDTQRKLFDVIYQISRALSKKTNVPQTQYPLLNVHTFQYFIFRYAMCMTLLYTR